MINCSQLPTSRTSLPAASDRSLRLPSCSAFSPRISIPLRLRWTDGGTIVWDGASVQGKLMYSRKMDARQTDLPLPAIWLLP